MSDTANRASIPFTNEHFAAFCLSMLGQPYWYGCCLYKCSESLRSRKASQYPSHYGSNRTSRYRQDIADKKVCADCIGAAKGYAWTGGGQGVLESIGKDKTFASKYGSNGCPDKGTETMFAYAKSKGMDWGTISTLPELVGVVLHKSGHVGYYVGNGYAVEWRGFNYGCVKTKVAGRGWTHWYKLPFIRYGETVGNQPDTVTPSALKKGASGEAVMALQKQLMSLGFSLPRYGADGKFGTETEAAVKAFQSANQLEVDGIVGERTWAALESMVQQGSTESVEAPPDTDEHAQGQAQDGGTPGNAETIRLRLTREENIAVYGANEISLDIEEYLRGVVPSEMYESAHMEALKAQGIASRTYACRRRTSGLTDTSNHQAFRASKIGKNPRSDEAIAATKGKVLIYDGQVIDCFFGASNGGQTKRSGDVWSRHYPYYVSKPDEWDEAAREGQNISRTGHGVGMSQHGAMWAARNGVNCEKILAFYYEGAMISENYGISE